MGRLNAKQRKDFLKQLNKLLEAYDDVTSEYECSYNSREVSPFELMFRKYRLAACIKLLASYGLAKEFEDLYMPQIEEIFLKYEPRFDEYIYEYNKWASYLENYLNFYVDYNSMYLERCLKNTNWKVFYITELYEYEHFPKEVINRIKGSIETHWCGINDTEDKKVESKYLTSLGVVADEIGDFYPYYNLILINDNLSKVFNICKKHPEYKETNEYKELLSVSRFCLFDRYFPYFSNKDFSRTEGGCINYLLGEIFSSKLEETDLYQLNYESVLLLMISDVIVDEFLDRYENDSI